MVATQIYTPQNKHGTWKWTLGKGDSYWKPSFPGSMLIFGGVLFYFHPWGNDPTLDLRVGGSITNSKMIDSPSTIRSFPGWILGEPSWRTWAMEKNPTPPWMKMYVIHNWKWVVIFSNFVIWVTFCRTRAIKPKEGMSCFVESRICQGCHGCPPKNFPWDSMCGRERRHIPHTARTAAPSQ